MNEKRMGEIALVLLKDQVNQRGLTLMEVGGRLPLKAIQTGIPYGELCEFTRIILSEEKE